MSYKRVAEIVKNLGREQSDRLARIVHAQQSGAREGAQTTVYHLRDFEVQRRQATLVAILLDTRATLIDEILDLHDRMVGSAFAKARRAYEVSFQESGKAINEKVRLYAQVGQALIKAKEVGIDPFAAIEQIVSWECFIQSVGEAEKLARSEDFDYLGLLGNHYSQFRRYTPTFLEAFECKAAPAAQKILDAIEVLKGLTISNSRSVPDDAPKDLDPSPLGALRVHRSGTRPSVLRVMRLDGAQKRAALGRYLGTRKPPVQGL